MPQRAARPDRGWTKAAYPSGSAIARPVGSTARSPGASSASTVVTTSAPASPGSAYAGSGTPGSRRWTRTSTGGGEVGKVGDGTAGKVTPATPGAGAQRPRRPRSSAPTLSPKDRVTRRLTTPPATAPARNGASLVRPRVARRV